ncbi:hypothetical protein DNTS_033325 [Danionella cerebrum]|uniref:Uncharacterized protein n=1 Tax=Danionella cerebrum TaxID=2873325 RepID=A0A553PUY2_9TELE|nr:hypothetical protein DNTS_033325 [Danionella translucida]
MTVVFSSSPFSSFVLDSSRHRVTVSPAGSMEGSTKAKSGSSFFERVLKGLKSPFRRRDEEVVEFSQSEMEDFEPGLAPAPGSSRTPPGASPPPPEASFEDVPEEKQRKRKTLRSFFHKCTKNIRKLFLCGGQDRSRHPSPEPDHKDHDGESSLLPQEEPLISSDPAPESSGHYHPSDLELEDLAFGNEIFCPPEIDDQPTFFAEPAYVWCLAAMYEKIMKACETNEWCYIIRLCLARDPADRLRLDQM